MGSQCSNCGAQMPDHVNTCSSCGRPTSVAIEAAQIESQQQLKSEASAALNIPHSPPAPSQTADQSVQKGQLIPSRAGEFLHRPHYKAQYIHW